MFLSYNRFKSASKEDINVLCQEVLEIGFDNGIVDYVNFHAAGSMRKAMKLIHTIEQRAKSLGSRQ